MVATQGQASAPAAAVVRVLGPTSPVRVGESFVVSLRIEGASDLGAFEFDFGSNPSVATAAASEFHLGSFLGSTGRTTGELRMASAPAAPGRPLYAAYSYGLPTGPMGTGQIATVTMQATGAGVTPLSLGNLKVTDISGTELPATSVSGAVEVRAGTRPLYLPLIRSNLL